MDVSLLIGEAEEASRDHDYETARDRYEAAVPMLDDHGPIVRGLVGFGWALYRLGDYPAALTRHEEALTALERVFPGDEVKRAVVQDAIAHALLRLGRADEALALFRTILASGIGGRARVVALNRAAETATENGRADEARRYQLEAVEIVDGLLEGQPMIDEDLETAVHNVVRVLMDGGRKEEAERLLRLLYARRSFRLVRRRGAPDGTLLVLGSWNGNVPDRHLLPRLNMNIVKWMLEFGEEADEESLPSYQLVLNLVGDADQGEKALARVASFEGRTQVPVLNRAAHVLRTRRDRIEALFDGIEGLVVPRCVRVSGAARTRTAAEMSAQTGLSAPLLLREAGRHGGETVVRLETEEVFARAWSEGSGDAYLTRYHDYASHDGKYRKYRVIFIDRRPYPYHLAISSNWLVHYFSADMIADDARREEELRFLADMEGEIGSIAITALEEIGVRMDLDYAGVDFSLLPDGRVLLFEANATMLVHPEARDGLLAAKNPYVERILAAFERLLREHRVVT